MQGIKCIITFTIDHLSVFIFPPFFSWFWVFVPTMENIYVVFLVIVVFFFSSIVALFLVVVCGAVVQIVRHAKIDGCCNFFCFKKTLLLRLQCSYRESTLLKFV